MYDLFGEEHKPLTRLSPLKYPGGKSHAVDIRRKFTKSSPSVMRVKTFNNPNISFQVEDFETALNNHPNVFAYLDPPYMIKSKTLYGEGGELHKSFDHERLARILNCRDNWVLSYNNCDEVKDLYKGFQFIFPRWKQTLGKASFGNEILILNVSQ